DFPISQTHWYLWDNGTATELPALTRMTPALDVHGFNASDTIIGDLDGTPFVYLDGTLYDLNSLLPANSGWTLTAAYGLNDAGQIVGTGTYNGDPSAFLLTPTSLSSVPEPSACAILVPTALLLLPRRRPSHWHKEKR